MTGSRGGLFLLEPKVLDDITNHEALEWKREEDRDAEEETGDVDEVIIPAVILKKISLYISGESGIAAQGENEAYGEGGPNGDVGHFPPFGLTRLLHRAVDHKRVVVTHEGKGKDAAGLDHARICKLPGIGCPGSTNK